jgi:hypothetical protein
VGGIKVDVAEIPVAVAGRLSEVCMRHGPGQTARVLEAVQLQGESSRSREAQ